MLYDNPNDWQTFLDEAATDPDITDYEKLLLEDYQSYTLRLYCDIRKEKVLDPGNFTVEFGNYTIDNGSGCCIKDQSEKLGGGYCVTMTYQEYYEYDGSETDSTIINTWYNYDDWKFETYYLSEENYSISLPSS